MRMLTLGLVLCALALALPGCASIQKLEASAATAKSAFLVATKTAVTQQQAGLLLTAYDTAEALANKWLALRPCKAGESYLTVACRDAKVAKTLNAIMDQGDPRADTLLADVKTAKAQGANITVAAEAFNLLLASKNDLSTATPATVK